MAVTLRGSRADSNDPGMDGPVTTLNVLSYPYWPGPGDTPHGGDLVVVSGWIGEAGQAVTQTAGTGAWTIVSSDTNSSGGFTSFAAWRVIDTADTAPGFSWGTAANWSYCAAAFIPDPGTTLGFDTSGTVLVAGTAGTSFTPGAATAAGAGGLSVILNAGVAAAAYSVPGQSDQVQLTPPSGWATAAEFGIPAENNAGVLATTAGAAWQGAVSGTVTPGAETLILGGSVSVYANVYHLLFKPSPSVVLRGFSGVSTSGAGTGNQIATQAYSGYGDPPQPGDMAFAAGILSVTSVTVVQSGGAGGWEVHYDTAIAGSFTAFWAFRVLVAGDTAPVFSWGGTQAEYACAVAIFKPAAGMALALDSKSLAQPFTDSNTFTVPNGVANAAGDVSVILTSAQTSATGANTVTQTAPSGWTMAGETQTSGTASDLNQYAGISYKIGVGAGTVTPGTETLACAVTLFAELRQSLTAVTSQIFPLFAQDVDPPPRPPLWAPWSAKAPGMPLGEPFQAWPYSTTIEAPLPASGPAYATAFGTPVGGTGTWVNQANAEGVPDGSTATWAVT